MITINPAKQLGIDKRVGSIEVGKDGDIAIFSHHPLSIYAINQKTIIDGIVRFDINTQPDDMRIDINPEESISSFMEDMEGHEDKCMQDVFTELFLGETHNHSHQH